MDGTQTSRDKRESTLLCGFGDSLTAGVFVDSEETFLSLLGHRFGMETRNAGAPGQTSEEALARMKDDVLDHRPAICTVAFGMNDHAAIGLNESKVPISAFGNNLRAMIDRLAGIGATPILCTIHPVLPGDKHAYYYNRHPEEWYAEPGGVNAWIAQYNDAVRSVAGEKQVWLADVAEEWKLGLQQGARQEELLMTIANSGRDDGVHLTPQGHQIYAACIGRVLEDVLRD